jgi:hypothetical protein
MKVTRIVKLGTTLAITSNQSTPCRVTACCTRTSDSTHTFQYKYQRTWPSPVHGRAALTFQLGRSSYLATATFLHMSGLNLTPVTGEARKGGGVVGGNPHPDRVVEGGLLAGMMSGHTPCGVRMHTNSMLKLMALSHLRLFCRGM